MSTNSSLKQAASKVPEVTLYFWIIKIMATTVGETFADFLSGTLGLGLVLTTVIMVVALAGALYAQFCAHTYVPKLYWLSVTLISVAGTLITDNLTDNLGVPLEVSTAVFGVALVITFALWFVCEKTLSIHSIRTTKREAFYWLAILFTFALGTAAGDLTGEKLGLGYAWSALMYATLIGVVAAAHYLLQAGSSTTSTKLSRAVVAFWLAYILTRPLGASLGDLLSQPVDEGGLGLTAVGTSALFLATILGLVIYLTRSKRDQITVPQ